MAGDCRERLVTTAMELFCKEGFQSVGIDRILKEANVAKMTLYKYFTTKDELVIAALRRVDEKVRNQYMQEIEKRSSNALEKLFVMLDIMKECHESRGLNGCAFIKAANEYYDHDHPVHFVAISHKKMMVGYVAKLLEEVGVADAKDVARQFCIVLEGAVSLSQVMGDSQYFDDARLHVERLVQAYVPVYA